MEFNLAERMIDYLYEQRLLDCMNELLKENQWHIETTAAMSIPVLIGGLSNIVMATPYNAQLFVTSLEQQEKQSNLAKHLNTDTYHVALRPGSRLLYALFADKLPAIIGVIARCSDLSRGSVTTLLRLLMTVVLIVLRPLRRKLRSAKTLAHFWTTQRKHINHALSRELIKVLGDAGVRHLIMTWPTAQELLDNVHTNHSAPTSARSRSTRWIVFVIVLVVAWLIWQYVWP